MTKEQKEILKKRLVGAEQYSKYFLIETMLQTIDRLERENKSLKEKESLQNEIHPAILALRES